MNTITKPAIKPVRSLFSSGPTAKPPSWKVNQLATEHLGRSHRSAVVKQLISIIINKQRQLLAVPDDWLLAITPASDTGALEAALWSMIGAKPVDALVFDAFSKGWAEDLALLLPADKLFIHRAEPGGLPDLDMVNPAHDLVTVLNGTTTGVNLGNCDWIASHRSGLVFCDATSSIFVSPIPWEKFDVVTWSWQKVLGGEAQHGMLALSPAAVSRLNSYQPNRPIPKVLRLAKSRALIEGIFRGNTINTPSLLCLSDAKQVLDWADAIGGVPAMQAQSATSAKLIATWVNERSWVQHLCEDPKYRSITSVCLRLLAEQSESIIAAICDLLANNEVAYDIAAYRGMPPGFRIWCGPTVASEDVSALLPWLDWAYTQVTGKTGLR